MNGKIFTIAGSDPSGGAGIQADIKTISALGSYAMAAVTALTIQNTQQVYKVHPVEGDVLAAQVTAVLDDIIPDAIKLGMLGSTEVVSTLSKIFQNYRPLPIIVDPVILSTSGYPLLGPDGVDVMIAQLFPMISLLTPNLAEAALLADIEAISSLDDMKLAGRKILSKGPKAVLVKGGHLSGKVLTDILVTHDDIVEFSSPKIESRNTHGTGCTLASACATGIGQGMALKDAVDRAHKYVHKAILEAPDIGQGKGPLNHFVSLD